MEPSRATEPEPNLKPGAVPAVPSDGGSDFAIGSIIAGRFVVEERLGGGGMSVVYRCRDEDGNQVAIKFLKPQLATEEKWLNRFKQEARAIGRLKHPNIIAVHEFSVDHNPPYLVMDYAQGISLADLIAREGTLELNRTLRMMNQVADALQHAHANGVVHRDLKPSNIMQFYDVGVESVKILDFGIAKINETEEPGIKMTQTGEIFGSPAYMSPEQSLGKKVDERTDQYAFGCVLFECLTGCPPFMGDNAVDTLMKQIHYNPPTLKEASLGKSFSPEVESFVAKMLNKDPAQRFESMASVQEHIGELLHPPNTFEKAMRQVKKTDWKQHRLGVIVGLSIGLGTAAIVGFTSWMLRPATVSEMDRGKNKAPVTSEDQNRAKDELAADRSFYKFCVTNTNANGVNLSNTPLTNSGIAALSNLRHLKSLHADACKNLNDSALSTIGSLTSLEALSIMDNRSVSDRGVVMLMPLQRLQSLRLARTNVSDKSIPVFARMHNLKQLDLSDTFITDAGLHMLSMLPLNGLKLDSEVTVTNKGVEYLNNMKTLRYLSLNQNPKLGQGLTRLGRLDLTTLNLAQTAVRDSDLLTLSGMKHLESLDLSGTGITDEGLMNLSKMKSLKSLRLHNNNALTPEGVQKFREALPGCDLSVSDNETFYRRASQQAEPFFVKQFDREMQEFLHK